NSGGKANTGGIADSGGKADTGKPKSTAAPAPAPVGRIAATLPLSGDLESGLGSLWIDQTIGTTAAQLIRIDPQRGTEMGAPIQTGQYSPTVAGTRNGVLVASSGTLLHLNRAGTAFALQTTPVCNSPTMIGDDADNVWYLDTSTQSGAAAGCDELA